MFAFDVEWYSLDRLFGSSVGTVNLHSQVGVLETL